MPPSRNAVATGTRLRPPKEQRPKCSKREPRPSPTCFLGASVSAQNLQTWQANISKPKTSCPAIALRGCAGEISTIKHDRDADVVPRWCHGRGPVLANGTPLSAILQRTATASEWRPDSGSFGDWDVAKTAHANRSQCAAGKPGSIGLGNQGRAAGHETERGTIEPGHTLVLPIRKLGPFRSTLVEVGMSLRSCISVCMSI